MREEPIRAAPRARRRRHAGARRRWRPRRRRSASTRGDGDECACRRHAGGGLPSGAEQVQDALGAGAGAGARSHNRLHGRRGAHAQRGLERRRLRGRARRIERRSNRRSRGGLGWSHSVQARLVARSRGASGRRAARYRCERRGTGFWEKGRGGSGVPGGGTCAGTQGGTCGALQGLPCDHSTCIRKRGARFFLDYALAHVATPPPSARSTLSSRRRNASPLGLGVPQPQDAGARGEGKEAREAAATRTHQSLRYEALLRRYACRSDVPRCEGEVESSRSTTSPQRVGRAGGGGTRSRGTATVDAATREQKASLRDAQERVDLSQSGSRGAFAGATSAASSRMGARGRRGRAGRWRSWSLRSIVVRRVWV